LIHPLKLTINSDLISPSKYLLESIYHKRASLHQADVASALIIYIAQ
jgi:hypothetical protein